MDITLRATASNPRTSPASLPRQEAKEKPEPVAAPGDGVSLSLPTPRADSAGRREQNQPAPSPSASSISLPESHPRPRAIAAPTVLSMDEPAPPAPTAGPALLHLVETPPTGQATNAFVSQLATQLSLDGPRAEVAARLASSAGVDPSDKVKGPMLATYADLTVKTASLGLAPDSLQMRLIEKVMVANLRDEQAAANATHVWNVGDGALEIGKLLNQAGAALSPQELGNRVVAAMLHDPPNKKPVGPSFLLHNKFAANRIDGIFAEARESTPSHDRDALDRLHAMARRRALDHHVAPAWMAFTTVGEAAKSLPSLKAATACLDESERRARLDALNGVMFDTILVKGSNPAVGLPTPEQLRESLHAKGIPVTHEEASTLTSLSEKLLDPIHADQHPPDAEHPTYRVKFSAAEQALLDGINASYRAEALSQGMIPEGVGHHFDWYTPPNTRQFPQEGAELDAALHMIAADGLANYAKADAFLVKAPDGSATPGKFLGFYPTQGPEVAYLSAQSDKPGGSYYSYRSFLTDMPAVADVAAREHDRTAGLVGQTLENLKTRFEGGYLSLDPKSSFEPWREAPHEGTPQQRRDTWVMANLDTVLPHANDWRAGQGLEPLTAEAVRGDSALLSKAITGYQSAYQSAFATRLNDLDATTPGIGAHRA